MNSIAYISLQIPFEIAALTSKVNIKFNFPYFQKVKCLTLN